MHTNEENFRAFFASLQDMVVVGTPDGRVLHANEAIIRKLGYDLKEMDEIGILGLHPAVHRREAEEIFAAMFRGERSSCPLPVQRRDGTLIPVETRVSFGKWDGLDCVFGIIKDLSSEQEALQKFDKLFDVNPAMIALTRMPERRYVEVNQSFLRTLGFSRDEVIGKTAMELDFMMDPDSLRKSAEMLSRDGCVRNLELQVKTRKGEILDGFFSGELIDVQGVQYLLTVMLNITDRKRMEEQLRRNEKKFRNYIDASPLGIFAANEQGLYTEVNPAACRLTGYTEEELLHLGIPNLILPEEHERAAAHFRKVQETGYAEGMYQAKRKDGSLFWLSVVASRTDENRLLAYCQDVTEQVETDEALRKQSMLQNTLMNISNTFINVSLECTEATVRNALATLGEFTDTDRAYVFTYDMEKKIAVNTHEWCGAGITPQIAQLQAVPLDAIQDMAASHQCGDTVHLPDVQALDPSEAIRQILEPQGVKSLLAIPMMDGSECIGFVGFDAVRTLHCFTDTEKRLLELFSLMMVNLLNRNRTQTELNQARAQAEAANKAKSQFLANMSHEIRTPLNGVIGFTELLKDTPLNTLQQQYVNNAQISGTTLLGIINDILDFSKIEAGMMNLEIIQTDLHALMENSVDVIKHMAEKKKIEVLLDIDLSMPRYAMVDPVRLQQIFTNLLGNAAKFTEKGEIEFKASFVRSTETDGIFSFSVRDTGIGISDLQKERLFKAFSQADGSTTRKFGGTGLGLIISDMLAREMGSKIHIDSKPGEGSVFRFSLTAGTVEGVHPDNATLAGIRRCLIIDDNANNRMILEHFLAHWGIGAVSCENGLAALKALDGASPFEVIICDYNMPYIDGLETIRLIREKLKLGADRQPVFLLHSSSDDAELHRKCDELGVRFRLTKPVKPYELFNALSHVRVGTDPEDVANTTESSFCGAAGSNRPEGRKSCSILIAEDVHMNMMVIKAMLQRHLPGAELLEASDGAQVVDKYRKKLPDLILMDVQMPVMDGIDATLEIREIERLSGRHIPIIALTAGAFKEEEEKCLAAGMDAFLAKPLDTPKMKVLIEQFLCRTCGYEHVE